MKGMGTDEAENLNTKLFPNEPVKYAMSLKLYWLPYLSTQIMSHDYCAVKQSVHCLIAKYFINQRIKIQLSTS